MNEQENKELNELKTKYNELEKHLEAVRNRYIAICEAHANKCMQFDNLVAQVQAQGK